MKTPERPDPFAELTKCSNEIYGSPLHAENATRYIKWLRYPPGEIWYAQGEYFMTPVHGTQLNVQKIDVPYGTSETEVIAHGVDLMTQEVDAPYEFVARQPKGHEVSYGRQTLSVIDHGGYSIERLKVYAERHKLAGHTLHGSLGALFDVICVTSGLKEPDQARPYVAEPSITRGYLLEEVKRPRAGRQGTFNRMIDTILSRQVRTLRPDSKGEVVLHGEVGFSSDVAAIKWEAMSYAALENIIDRHSLKGLTRRILKEIASSQT